MRFHLAIAEDRLGHFDEAVKHFEALLAMDPKNAAAMNYLGYSWADRGMKLEEAEKLLRQAVAQEPENGAFLDSLGWVRFKRGDVAEARTWLQKAAERTPDALIYEHLGDVYAAEAHPEAAVQAWSKAISLDPKNVSAQKKLREGAREILADSGARKYLKYLEGNFRQAQNLAGGISIQARWSKRPLQAEGRLYYLQPDRMVLDVPGSDKHAAVRMVLEGKSVRMEPPQPKGLNGMAFIGLSSLSQYLAGQLTDSLEAKLDSRKGMQTRFTRENPSGGRDEIDVVSFDLVEGLWLPAEIRFRNATLGWNALLKFSEWTVNSPDNSKPFR
jgi:tetratricopeptide (TPR) repeat protein